MGKSVRIRHLIWSPERGVNALRALGGDNSLICHVTDKGMFKVKEMGHAAAFSANPKYPLS